MSSRQGSSGSSSRAQAVPLRLTLHLATPPNDKLQLSPTAEACKQAFMGQLKEADFLRWGNTKRMTGLRKAEQDGMWEGIKERSSPSPICFFLPSRSSPFSLKTLPRPEMCVS
jgi:autophagy-related protein 5